MAIFNYQGMNASGKKVSGTVDAENAKAARLKLRKINVFPTEVLEAGKKASFSLNRDIQLFERFRRVKPLELAAMTRQLATLVKAQIPLADALGILVDQIENPLLKKSISDIRERVNEGSRFAAALKDHPKIFDSLFVNMIEAGEAAGALELVLDRLAVMTEGQASLRGKILNAMFYPMIMLGISFVALTVILVFVIPSIVEIFDSFDKKLPDLTLAVIAVSQFFQNYWFLFPLAALGIFYGYRLMERSESGRLWLDQRKLKSRFFGKLVRMISISRFSSTLATMLGSGVRLLVAMDIVKNIVQNRALSNVIEETKVSIKEGESIAEPLKRSGQFPPFVIQMIRVGEKTGELEGMLEQVSKSYEEQIQRQLTTLPTVFNTILMLVLGVIVLLIVLAVVLPMLDMMNLGTGQMG